MPNKLHIIRILKPYLHTNYIEVLFLVGGSKHLLETVTNRNTDNWSNQKHKLYN
jgi:hypothetical protein